MKEDEKNNQETAPESEAKQKEGDTFWKRVKRGLPVVGKGVKNFFQNYNSNVNTGDLINPRKAAKKTKKKKHRQVIRNETPKKETSKETTPINIKIYIGQKPEE